MEMYERAEVYAAEYEKQAENEYVKEEARKENSGRSFGRSLGRFIRALIRFIKNTSFHVSRKDRLVFTMPTWVLALILFFVWEPVLAVMLISLFFGVRYSFSGSRESRTANRVMHKAGDFAQDIRDEFVQKDKGMA